MASKNKRRFITAHNRDYYAGGVMVLLGLWAITQGLTYRFGSLTNMGPGFFPVALGAILVLLGVAIAGSAVRKKSSPAPEEELAPEWRGWLSIILGIVAFVALGRFFGLLPATFAIVFISALGDRNNSIASAATLAVVISIICTVVFWWGLQVQFPLLVWWRP